MIHVNCRRQQAWHISAAIATRVAPTVGSAMYLDNPTTFAERLGKRSALRARFPSRPHPGPAAMRMLGLLAGVFHTPLRWRAITLIGAVVTATVLLVLLAVRLATWNADFFDALEQRSWDGVVRQSWIFLGIVAATMVVQATSLQSKRMLQITLRAHLTTTLLDLWMAEGRAARLQDAPMPHANEDGRIAEDGRVVCEMVVDFLASLLYAVLQFLLFVGMLWLVSGPLFVAIGGVSVMIPGHMLWVALAYAAFGAALTVRIGHPLVRATERRQGAEAGFRAGLVNAVTHAGSIALARAEPDERQRLAERFGQVRGTWGEQTISFRRMAFLTSGFGLLTAALPMLLLAPRFLDGAITLGTLIQVTIAFGQVTAALFWMSDNYPNIAQWEASAERVLVLDEAAADLAAATATARPGEVARVEENGPGLAFRDVSLVSAAGEVLVARFSAEIGPSERVLVEATPEAAEALFRAIAGLAPWGSGRIEMPEGVAPFFLGERPYLPEAVLKQVLAEPRGRGEVPEAELSAVLVAVGLAHLIPAIDTTAAWEQELGLADQQRLGIARALLHRPAWLFMHEALSALDAEDEERLTALIVSRLPDATLVTITHRTAVERLHQRRIALSRSADYPPPASESASA
jgi:putative ATP-binding cassette transporter